MTVEFSGEIEAPIGNYYGTPYVEARKTEGKIEYYFCIEDWDGVVDVKVSKKFYKVFKKEFEDKTND